MVLFEGRGSSPFRAMTIPWDFWLIFAVLGILIPWRGAVRVRRLLAMPEVAPMDRLTIYASTIAFQWLLAAVVAWRCYARGVSAEDLGLIIRTPAKTAVVTAILLLFFGLLQYAGIRRMAAQDPSSASHLRQISMRLMPRSSVEAMAFVALATTASLCEEFLFRGFVFAAIVRATSSASSSAPMSAGTSVPTSSIVAAVVGSSILFSLAHLYQGKRGLITTFFLGLLLIGSRIWTGNLVPAIAGHMLVDLMAGYLAPKYLNRAATEGAR
ncbi:MAG TPA: CPBP family intramembrane glutamic endopeptidase [Candidatus Acidoferrales bacterium]|jgi:membrane protease YdiL (CAAX protease family)|nr:CPBP family intramembrane glutamic endopeptidase [Candidatus Acidoferrales bacterium]